MTKARVAWAVWAILTASALGGSFFLGASPGVLVFFVGFISLSLGLARCVMIFRHRGGRTPQVNRWRRPIAIVYGVSFLAVVAPSFFAGKDLSTPSVAFVAAWFFFGPILLASLGAGDPNRPGWIRSEVLTAAENQSGKQSEK